MSEVTKDVEVARLVKPRFLSLVGTPANQIAFKVVRDDTGEITMNVPHIQRRRTARRSDALVSIEFSIDTAEDDIQKTMADWGISEYAIETIDNKRVVKCSDSKDAATMRINIGENRVAVILKPISTARSDEKPGIALVGAEFAIDYFPSSEDAFAWLRAHNIDFSKDGVQNTENVNFVRCGDGVEKTEDTRKIKVDDGVQLVVARAQIDSIPQDFIAVVNDAAYGSWGWGQLDFAATMADVEFCDVSQEAIYTLNRVVDRILYYSELPISVRKDLIAGAAGQFAEFVGTLMDALPARVVIANRSILRKEKSMSKENGQSGQAVERQEDTATQQQTTAPEAGASTTQADTPISRADVEKMIGDAVGGLSAQLAELSAKIPAPAETAAETKREDNASEAAAAATEDTSGETMREILRCVKDLADSVKSVNERVQSLEGGTVVRSDAGDTKQTQRKDVFKGMFGGKQA